MLLLKALFHRIAAIFIFKYRSACNYQWEPLLKPHKHSTLISEHTIQTVFNRGKTRQHQRVRTKSLGVTRLANCFDVSPHLNHFSTFAQGSGIGVGVARSQRFSCAVSSLIPKNARSWSQICLFNSGSPIGEILHHTPKLWIPVEMVQFLLKFCWNREFLPCTTISVGC